MKVEDNKTTVHVLTGHNGAKAMCPEWEGNGLMLSGN